MTGIPVTIQPAACLLAGILMVGQASAADNNGSPWDCHTMADGTVECIGRQTPPTPAPEPAPQQLQETLPQTVVPAEPSGAQVVTPAGPATPAVSAATAVARRSADQNADNPWGLCASTPPSSPTESFTSIPKTRRNATIDVEADSVELQEEQIYTLKGNVALQRADQNLHAQHLMYDKRQGNVVAQGSVRYSESGLAVASESMQLDMNTNHARLTQVKYYLPLSHARGSAKTVILEGPGIQKLEQASYTTCDPSREDWRLSAKHVTLLQDDGTGRARGVVMRFKKVPIFYTPFISFPLDDRRKSGLLAPSIGGSAESGADFRIPYYWNIASNHDATITPRWLEKRGTQLGVEFRYLNRNNHGNAAVEYLPSDNQYGHDRSLISLEHQGWLTNRVSTLLLFKEISDRQYFEDLGDSLNIASITHLERRAEIAYHGNYVGLSARLQDFQTVDAAIAKTDRPYERLPQIRLSAASPWQPLGLYPRLDAEYTYFDHEVNVSGHRLDIQPRISLPLQGAAYFFTPQVAVRHTRYELDDPLTPGASQKPERTTPIYSVDTGLFLDRDTHWRSNQFIQTLEPRAFYLYVPNRDQDELPVFDTGEYDFQLSRMFQENRFSGPDRMGDANQLTVALTTRILDPVTGTQHLSASIGEIIYFRDLEVTLPGNTAVTDNKSDLIADFQLQLFRQWELSTGLQWNPNKTRAERGQARIQYQPNDRHVVNLSYRYRRDVLDQVDASFLWELTRNWSAVGRWNYSFDDRTTLESFGGIEHDSCCWALRLVARKFVNRNDGSSNRSLYLQIEFKGLGAVGNSVDTLLERGILGYRRTP